MLFQSLPLHRSVLRAGHRGQARKSVTLSMGSAAHLPATYRRLIGRKTGPSFRDVAEVEECKVELPSEGQVLVRIAYAGVNGGCETFRVRGTEYTPFARNKTASSFALGAEGAGIVSAIGEGVHNVKVGDAVTVGGANAFAEYVTTSAQGCFPVRAATPEAVVLTLSGLTAAVALQGMVVVEATGGPLREGERAMITAAGGATGHIGAQLALLAGCHVVATCGGPEKAERLKALGVHRVINYKEEDVAEVLREEYPGTIDVAYEGVGGPLRDAVLDSMAPEGRMLCVGYISEYFHAKGDSHVPAASSRGLPPAHELMWQGQTVHLGKKTVYGQVWAGANRKDMDKYRRQLFDLHEAGKLQAWVDERRFHGVEQVTDSIEYMLSGQALGKVVVSF